MAATILPFPPSVRQRFDTFFRRELPANYEIKGPTKGGFYLLKTDEGGEFLTVDEWKERSRP